MMLRLQWILRRHNKIVVPSTEWMIVQLFLSVKKISLFFYRQRISHDIFSSHRSVIPQSFLFVLLSLFIKNQFRVCPILSIRANDNKIHIGKNPKTALSAEFRFQLIA